MRDNFERCAAEARQRRQGLIADFGPGLGRVLQSEGGYVDDPLDNGGATDHGITQRVFDAWRRSHGLAVEDVRLITDSEVQAIYHAQYWLPIRGDDLPGGVDYAAFDYAVNSGVKRAAMALQQAAGSIADGSIGPLTLAAANAADPRRLISAICAERLAFLETLSTWPHFGVGWSNRVAQVEQIARGMAQ